MSKKLISLIWIIVIAILVTMLISGCLGENAPPDIGIIQRQFQDNRDDIQTVISFMINSEYENIYIQNNTGTMVADLNDVKILDVSVSDAVNRILKKYIGINKIGNTIYIIQWRSAQDIGCGIAYTVNGIETPEIEFLTELVPLSEDGWYYYISDYNRWRSSAD